MKSTFVFGVLLFFFGQVVIASPPYPFDGGWRRPHPIPSPCVRMLRKLRFLPAMERADLRTTDPIFPFDHCGSVY
jgi:hypothetical protein